MSHFHLPALPPSLPLSLQVRAIVLENMGDDAKVQDYLKANGDDKAEFAAMGFDSLDLVEFSMAIQKVREPAFLLSLPLNLLPFHHGAELSVSDLMGISLCLRRRARSLDIDIILMHSIK